MAIAMGALVLIGAELAQQQPPVAVAGTEGSAQVRAGEPATSGLGFDIELTGALPGRRIPRS